VAKKKADEKRKCNGAIFFDILEVCVARAFDCQLCGLVLMGTTI
jgi:hypothetical protein